MAGRSLTRVRGGITDTILINRDKFAGVRTMSRHGKPLDDSSTKMQVTVTQYPEFSGVYTRFSSNPIVWKQEGGLGKLEISAVFTNSSGSTVHWALSDSSDNDPRINIIVDYPLVQKTTTDCFPWDKLSQFATYNIVVAPVPETISVDHTAPVITSDRNGESRPLLSKLVGGSAAAYSFRDLNDKAGNNKVIRVRRTIDDVERDFSANELRGSADVLVAWVKAGNLPDTDLPQNVSCICKWYDQSGNNRHAEQPDPTKQPELTRGTSDPYNGAGGVTFDGSSNFFNFTNNIVLSESSPLSVFCLQDAQTGADNFTLGTQDSNRGISFKQLKVFYYFSKKAISIHADNNQPRYLKGMNLFTVVHDGNSTGTNVRAYRNGIEVIDNVPDVDMGSEQFTNSLDYLGKGLPANYLSGVVKELIIYTEDHTNNRPAIEANIKNQYNL